MTDATVYALGLIVVPWIGLGLAVATSVVLPVKGQPDWRGDRPQQIGLAAVLCLAVMVWPLLLMVGYTHIWDGERND